MKAAKTVLCPSNIAALNGTCYLHPDGEGIALYVVHPSTKQELVTVWCRRRPDKVLECNAPSKPVAHLARQPAGAPHDKKLRVRMTVTASGGSTTPVPRSHP
jgi:hypothetical protein